MAPVRTLLSEAVSAAGAHVSVSIATNAAAEKPMGRMGMGSPGASDMRRRAQYWLIFTKLYTVHTSSSVSGGSIVSAHVGAGSRFTKGDPASTNAHVARLIRERRIQAKLTQADLAKLIGTTESVISRLEDTDCEGHSLTMQPPARGASE